MNRGIGQNRNTCWFYSALNIFILSDNGFKILWDKMNKVYKVMTASEKAFFNSNFNTPKPNSIHWQIYLWKFLNEYTCAVGGPSRLRTTAYCSRQLMKNMPFSGAGVREAKGLAPGIPSQEIDTILQNVGLGASYKFVSSLAANASWTRPMIIYRQSLTNNRQLLALQSLPLVVQGYELSAASVYIKSEDRDIAHAITCVIRNGRGYIFDSAWPANITNCKWYDDHALRNQINTRFHNPSLIAFSFVVYTKKEFTDSISPYCLLPASYKNMTVENLREMNVIDRWHPNMARVLMKYNNTGSEANMAFTPRVRAEVVRQYGTRPRMTANNLNTVLSVAKSYKSGIALANKMRSRNGKLYVINKNGSNYLNFKKKLLAKFPKLFPLREYMAIIMNASSNANAMNRLKRYATEKNYAFNAEKMQQVLNRRASTRSGKKRKQNMNK